MPTLLYFTLLSSALVYSALIVAALFYWKKKVDFSPADNGLIRNVHLSILIPFRNEALHLPQLLQALGQQSLDRRHWECIFINDHSEDQGPELISRNPVDHFRLISSPGEGKKKAIDAGVSVARGNFYVQTDADCVMGAEWLKTIYDQLTRREALVIAGPVCIQFPVNALDYFQAFDFIAFMGMTHLGIQTGLWHLANGANLTYDRVAYHRMKNTHQEVDLASGDDMFLMQAAAEINKEKIFFLQNPAITVETRAIQDPGAFIQQRLRWGSKTGKLKDWKLKLALGFTALFSLLLIIALTYSLFTGKGWKELAIFWLSKWTIDFIYLRSLAPFFNQKIPWRPYLICALAYPFYLGLMVILSIFKRNYEWKGRITR